ncbi:MAG: RHS repeat-associated core domain-containing protein [Fimbriimonas sp.]
MPTTSYYTVDGEILAEDSVGSRTDYVTDALGSIVATESPAGAIVNQYRYKPYGASLSSSGSGSTPRFRWIGAWGYVSTSRAHSDVYVRARHYGGSTGRWTTADPAGYGDGWNLYRYAKSNPLTLVDPSGHKAIKITVDDGPESYSTQRYINEFGKRNLKVGFYVVGSKVTSGPGMALAKNIHAAGHVLANHTNCHNPRPWCKGTPVPGPLCDGFKGPTLTIKEMGKQWCDCHNAVEKITGVKMNRFRSPGGVGWLRCQDDIKESAKALEQFSYMGESTGAAISDAGEPGAGGINWIALDTCVRRWGGTVEKCPEWKVVTANVDKAIRQMPLPYNNILIHDSKSLLTVDYINPILNYIVSKGHTLTNFG